MCIKYGYVYLTTNKVNGKKYVGQHVCTNFDKNYKGSGVILKQAMNKYGRSNFTCEVIEWCSTQDELNTTEQKWISEYDTITPNGYNLLSGGKQGGQHCEETKLKMSEAHKGRKQSKEWVEKRASKRRGVPISEEQKNHLREVNTGKKASEATKKKLSASLINNKRCKKVYQYDLNGNYIGEFACANEVTRQLGFNGIHIRDCCIGVRRSANGFMWSYEKTKNLKAYVSKHPKHVFMDENYELHYMAIPNATQHHPDWILIE